MNIEDIFSDSLQSLYDYVPLTHSSAGAVFRYTLTDTHHRLQSRDEESTPSESSAESSTITLVTPTTEAGNWALHASSIWASSLFIADHLDDLHLDEHAVAARNSGRHRLRLLELGAGAGLPSIAIAKCFNDIEVVASDYPDPELIKTLQANVDTNHVDARCRVVPYAWGSDPALFRQGAISENGEGSDNHAMDIIIAADTLWNPALHDSFLKTLQTLLRRSRDACVYLVAGLHTGRYTLQAFIDALDTYGLVLEEAVERESTGCGQRVWSVDRAEGEEEKERRRWIIWMRIKWNQLQYIIYS